MSSAAQVGAYINIEADLNFYTMQQIFWANKYEANSKKLQEQVKYEEKWEKAYEEAQDVDKTCKIGTKVYKEKDQVLSDSAADNYAHLKVKQYNEELSLELAELDVEYDAMKSMYEALVTELTAQKDTQKQSAATALQNTHMIQS